MDPRRAQVERNAHFSRGPRFFREGEGVMFEFVIDAGNVIGPRPATKVDSVNHAEAWQVFTRAGALAELAREDADLIIPERSQGQPNGALAPRRKARS